MYWLGCSQRGQVQGSFVWNISNHFQRVMRISLAWNSLSLLFLSPVTIYPLACIFHKGGTNQLLSFSPEPCLQQPFVCTEGMETGIRRLIPLEEVASLRVTTVRFALEKQEKTDIGRRHGSKAIARRSSRRKFRPTRRRFGRSSLDACLNCLERLFTRILTLGHPFRSMFISLGCAMRSMPCNELLRRLFYLRKGNESPRNAIEFKNDPLDLVYAIRSPRTNPRPRHRSPPVLTERFPNTNRST